MSYYRDKVALVTGGAAGIGAELVRQLSSAGAAVVIADLAKDAAATIGRRIELRTADASRHAKPMSLALTMSSGPSRRPYSNSGESI